MNIYEIVKILKSFKDFKNKVGLGLSTRHVTVYMRRGLECIYTTPLALNISLNK